MALITASGTLNNAAVPFDALAATARITGTATSCTLDLGPGTSFVVLTGTGLTYDAQLLPSGGTITSVQLFASAVDLVWTASGFSVDAAEFRANAGDLDSFLFGGADTVLGGSTFDHLFGYGGADSIAAGAGNDGIVAGEGNDTVSPGTGTDGIDLGAGEDLLNIGDALNGGTKYADGGAGIDTLRARGDISASVLQGFERLAWQSPSDPVRLTGAQLAGFSVLDLGSLSPTDEAAALEVTGGGLVDLGPLALVGLGVDLLEVALIGATGTMLRGRDTGDGAADDHVDALGSGNDSIATFGGNDSITAMGGNDFIGAGDGDDHARIILGDALVLMGDGQDTAIGAAGAETMDGEAGDDVLSGGDGADLLIGGDGLDSLLGGLAADRLFGGLGNDTLLGGDGSDTISGGDGADSIDTGSGLAAVESVRGGAGNDVIIGAGGLFASAHLLGEGDNDTITSNAFRSTIDGGAGDDVLTGSSLTQGAGNTALTSTDTIIGGTGNDLLTGGLGADLLTGGSGADTFAYGPGDGGNYVLNFLVNTDVISDFNRAEGDRIDLSRIDADVLTALDQAFDELLPAGSATPVTAGSLRYAVGASATTIEGSMDGDATMELRITINVAGYTPILGDFIL